MLNKSIQNVLFLALIQTAFVCCNSGEVRAQSPQFDVDNYLENSVPSDPVNVEFDFDQMSNYIDKKDELLNALLDKRDELTSSYYLNQEDLAILSNLRNELDTLETLGDGVYDIRDLLIELEDYYLYFDYQNTGKITEKARNKIIARIKQQIEESTTANYQLKTLKANINTVSSDIESCKEAMDSALKTEDRKQKFTRTVAIAGFSVIFLIIGLFFYTMLARGKAEDVARLIGFTGLQFITLFAVIICLVIFGILNMIPGSELASILSAISGFILGKGNYERETTLQKTSQDS